MADQSSTYTLQIRVDGGNVAAEAERIRAQIENGLGTSKTSSGGKVSAKDQKAAVRAQEREVKLLEQAQTLSAEIGMQWADVEEIMGMANLTAAELLGTLRLQKTENAEIVKAQKAQERAMGSLRKEAAALGIPWAEVEEAIDKSDMTTDDLLGSMKRVRAEMAKAENDARDFGNTAGGAVDGIAIGFDGLYRSISESREQFEGITHLAGDLSAAGATMTQTGMAITGTLVASGTKFVNFSRSVGVAARSLDLTTEQTKTFESVLMDMSSAGGFTAPEALAEGVTVWAKAIGQTANTQADMERIIMQTMPAQKLAALSEENLGMVLEGGAAALRQFKLPASDLDMVLGVMNKTAAETVADFSGVVESFKMIGPSASALGVDINDVSAVIGLLAENGLQGSIAGRGLSTALDDVAAPSAAAKAQLEAMFGDESPFFRDGKFVGLPNMIEGLAIKMRDLSDEERASALSTIFSANAKRALTPLIESQIEAQERGINITRAFSKNLQGIADDEVEAWAQMKLETEGVIIDMRGGLDRLQGDWAHYSESNNKLIDETTTKWKTFWLTFGSNAVDVAIPALEDISETIEKITDFTESNPEFTRLAAWVGGGAIALGTLTSTVGNLMRAATAIYTTLKGLQAWATKRATADTKFEATVISSAETFKAIITEAATSAAATEQGGAVTETATEVAGGGVETATEVEGGFIETAAEISSASAAALAFETALILAIPALAVGLAIAVYDALVKAGIGPWKDSATGAQWATVIAHGIGKMTGGEERGLKYAEAAWNFFGKKEQEEAANQGQLGLSGLGMSLTAAKEYAMAQEAADSATSDAAESIWDFERAVDEAGTTADQRERASSLYVDLLEREADATEKFNEAMADAIRSLGDDLSELNEDYISDRSKLERDYQRERIEEERDYQEEDRKALEEHQKKMARLQEDHEGRMFDLELSRDAAGLLKEQRSYEQQKSRAKEDFSDDQSEQSRDRQLEQAERQADHQQQLADQAEQYQERRAERIAQHQERVAELQTNHDSEMSDLRADYFEKINAELNYYTQSEGQQLAYQEAMLADAQTFLTQNRNLWINHIKSLPVPKATTTKGGGSKISGKSTLSVANSGAMSFASPNTMRQIEGVSGGTSAAGAGQPQIMLPLTISQGGMSPREVAKLAGQVVENHLVELLKN